MAFYNIDSERFNEKNEPTFSDKIIILKKVKTLKQLRKTERELVRLNYKEAIIKGFTLKGIQQYIASKTKIWIEWSCLEYLKKTEEQENKEWYLRLAKDHFAYIGIHREAIDEIQQLKNELWKIAIHPKSENSEKIAAIKELHNIVKTKALLLRDLPFITKLSKYYDLTMFDNSLESSKSSSSIFRDDKQNIATNSLQKEHTNEYESSEKQFNYNAIKDSHLNDTINSPSNYRSVDDEIMEAMQAKIPKSDTINDKSKEEMTDGDLNKLITPAHRKTKTKAYSRAV